MRVSSEWTQMPFLSVLHVLAMFVAFAFTTGAGIVMAAIANAGDVRVIRIVSKTMLPFQAAGGVVLVLGVVFGFGTAVTAGFTLTSKWLIVAYVLAALIIFIGLGIHGPWTRRLAAAAASSPDGAASPELSAVLSDRTVRMAGPISGLLWIAVIAVMVLKPS